MLDANTSSGPDHERPGLEKETSEPPHGKLEKADPGPVSACTANIGDRKSSPSREGRPTTREDGRGRDFQSDRVKSMRRQSLLSVALENPFERLPLQPFPSYAANGKFLLHSRPSPPICLLLTCISQSAQSLHCPFLQNPRQAFLKSLLPPIHIPLDMIGIKAMITQQGATRDNRPSQERLPPRPFPSYATNALSSRMVSSYSFRSLPNRHRSCSPCIANLDDRNYCSYGITSAARHDTEVKGSDLALTFSMPTPICLQLRTYLSISNLHLPVGSIPPQPFPPERPSQPIWVLPLRSVKFNPSKSSPRNTSPTLSLDRACR
ncbi:hypothetical protein V8E54_014977 [Elaphomyces granulatus]